ncbi:FecR domain-containing protein [Comamonas composti]|uniref:FecR domain-containing protein n=1 Tax=Comamonas composti TaxID=408558 RepID=UPI000409E876|nr:FecR domain-containing protein [Comamonas composti]
MSRSTPAPGIDPRAAREAAQWLVRLQTETPDAAQQQALCCWRAADPRHEAAWQRAEQVLQQLGHGSASNTTARSNAPAMVPGPLGPAGATALRLSGQAGRAQRRAAARMLALAIVAGPAAVVAWRQAPWQDWTADVRTATGEQRELTLPDGGRLRLDTASAVDIAYSADSRRIVLHSGALWVQTAPDAAGRPFQVQTPQGSALALGTRFTVRTAEQRTQVAVSQGAVELRPAHGGRPVRIAAGEQASTTVDEVGAIAGREPLAEGWTEGVLYADKMPLGQFTAELARYRRGLLRCDPAVAHLPVSGAFQLADTDAALTALAASLPVRVDMRTRWWVTLSAQAR